MVTGAWRFSPPPSSSVVSTSQRPPTSTVPPGTETLPAPVTCEPGGKLCSRPSKRSSAPAATLNVLAAPAVPAPARSRMPERTSTVPKLFTSTPWNIVVPVLPDIFRKVPMLLNVPGKPEKPCNASPPSSSASKTALLLRVALLRFSTVWAPLRVAVPPFRSSTRLIRDRVPSPAGRSMPSPTVVVAGESPLGFAVHAAAEPGQPAGDGQGTAAGDLSAVEGEIPDRRVVEQICAVGAFQRHVVHRPRHAGRAPVLVLEPLAERRTERLVHRASDIYRRQGQKDRQGARQGASPHFTPPSFRRVLPARHGRRLPLAHAGPADRSRAAPTSSRVVTFRTIVRQEESAMF